MVQRPFGSVKEASRRASSPHASQTDDSALANEIRPPIVLLKIRLAGSTTLGGDLPLQA